MEIFVVVERPNFVGPRPPRGHWWWWCAFRRWSRWPTKWNDDKCVWLSFTMSWQGWIGTSKKNTPQQKVSIGLLVVSNSSYSSYLIGTWQWPKWGSMSPELLRLLCATSVPPCLLMKSLLSQGSMADIILGLFWPSFPKWWLWWCQHHQQVQQMLIVHHGVLTLLKGAYYM